MNMHGGNATYYRCLALGCDAKLKDPLSLMGHQRSNHLVTHVAMGGGLTGDAVIHASEQSFWKIYSGLLLDKGMRKIEKFKACDGCRRRKIKVTNNLLLRYPS